MAPFPRLTLGHPRFRLLATVLFLVFFLAGERSAHAQIADGIAAVVNTEVIPFSEVQKHVEDTERVLRDTYQGKDLIDRIKEARLNALRALIATIKAVVFEVYVQGPERVESLMYVHQLVESLKRDNAPARRPASAR